MHFSYVNLLDTTENRCFLILEVKRKYRNNNSRVNWGSNTYTLYHTFFEKAIYCISPDCRPSCAITAPSQFTIMIPSKECRGNESRIAPNSMTEHRKPERKETLRRENMRLSATKITSIVFCAAQRTKIPNAC